MSQSQMDPGAGDHRVQFRFGRAPLLRDALYERASRRHSVSDVAERDLARYYELLRRALPTFSAPEASLIVDACNGWLVEPHSAPLLWAEVADAISLDGLDAKWGVDGAALIARLRTLTPFEALACADAAERFWLRPELPTPENLVRVGLVQPLIVSTPDVCGGQPRIASTRLTVELVKDLAAAGYDAARIQQTYPHLTPEQIAAALSYEEPSHV